MSEGREILVCYCRRGLSME